MFFCVDLQANADADAGTSAALSLGNADQVVDLTEEETSLAPSHLEDTHQTYMDMFAGMATDSADVSQDDDVDNSLV